MNVRADQTPIYHITDADNLPGILAGGGLRSDADMAQHNPAVIGYAHIKRRRLTEIRVDCCNNRFVGEFVPFYFCPRSPMLYTINLGALATLDWAAIRATQWQGRTHQKSAEFLVADFFDWSGFHAVGCHNAEMAQHVVSLLATQTHRPAVRVEPSWYY